MRGFKILISKLAAKWLMEDKKRVYVVSDIEKRDEMRKLYPELTGQIICADEVTWDAYRKTIHEEEDVSTDNHIHLCPECHETWECVSDDCPSELRFICWKCYEKRYH